MTEQSMATSAMRALRRRLGKDDAIDPALGAGFFAHDLWWRSRALLRGLVRFHTKAFVGAGVKIRGRHSITLGSFATLDDGVIVHAHSRTGVRIGARTKVGAGSRLLCTAHPSHLGEGITIGDDSALGEWCYLGAAGGITIGDNVIGGQYIGFHSQNHNFDGTDRPIRLQGTVEEPIVVEDNVWIGAKVTFLAGAHVSEHSVVAAGAVVGGAFPPGVIIGGVPARVLKEI